MMKQGIFSKALSDAEKAGVTPIFKFPQFMPFGSSLESSLLSNPSGPQPPKQIDSDWNSGSDYDDDIEDINEYLENEQMYNQQYKSSSSAYPSKNNYSNPKNVYPQQNLITLNKPKGIFLEKEIQSHAENKGAQLKATSQLFNNPPININQNKSPIFGSNTIESFTNFHKFGNGNNYGNVQQPINNCFNSKPNQGLFLPPNPSLSSSLSTLNTQADHQPYPSIFNNSNAIQNQNTQQFKATVPIGSPAHKPLNLFNKPMVLKTVQEKHIDLLLTKDLPESQPAQKISPKIHHPEIKSIFNKKILISNPFEVQLKLEQKPIPEESIEYVNSSQNDFSNQLTNFSKQKGKSSTNLLNTAHQESSNESSLKDGQNSINSSESQSSEVYSQKSFYSKSDSENSVELINPHENPISEETIFILPPEPLESTLIDQLKDTMKKPDSKSKVSNEKKDLSEVQILRQRVKELEKLNKNYLKVIGNLSETVKNLSLGLASKKNPAKKTKTESKPSQTQKIGTEVIKKKTESKNDVLGGKKKNIFDSD